MQSVQYKTVVVGLALCLLFVVLCPATPTPIAVPSGKSTVSVQHVSILATSAIVAIPVFAFVVASSALAELAVGVEAFPGSEMCAAHCVRRC